MPILSNRTSPQSIASLLGEASRRVALGDSASFLFIVPNRIAQQRIERALVASLPGRAVARLNVLTLADFAGSLCKVAFPDLRLLSDAESAVLIEQAIRDLIHQGHLEYFERAAEEDAASSDVFSFPIPRGTLELVVNTIRQLKESGVTVEDIGRDIQSVRERRGESTEVRRAADIMLIYEAYMNSLFGKFMDTYGQTLLLNARHAGVAADLRTCYPDATDIFIDGFYYLERPSIQLLATLSRSTDVTVTMNLDSRSDNPELFGEVLKLQADLQAQGFQEVGEVSREVIGSSGVDGYRAWLRRHLFAAPEASREKLHASEVNHWSAISAVEEVEEIARKIKLVFENDPEIRADLSRIVVATPMVEAYTPLFQEAFRRNEIPVQIADRYRLDQSPLMLSLLSLFDIARFGLRRREIIRVLGSPYFDFRHVETGVAETLDARNMLDVLTRYKPNGDLPGWKRSLNGHLNKVLDRIEASEDPGESRRLVSEQIQISRALRDLERLAELIRPLEQNLTPAQFTVAARSLLMELRVEECLLRQSALTLAAGTLELDVQAYREIISLLVDLESLFALIGKSRETLPLAYYTERLKAAAIWVRYSPRSRTGAVLVTSLAQSTAQPADYLFVAGLIDGALPALYQPQVFLMNDMQKGERRQLLEDRVLFYQAITNFRRRLSISYPKRPANGGVLARSIFVDSLEEVLKIEEGELAHGMFSYRDLYFRPKALAANVIEEIEGRTAGQSSVSGVPYLQALREQMPRSVLAQTLREGKAPSIFRGGVDEGMLTEAEQHALRQNRDRVWSITQLETYGECPFRYFSRYELKLGESDEGEEGLDARDRGSILHEVLREFLTSRRDEQRAPLQKLSDAELIGVYNELCQLADHRMERMASEHPFWRLDVERLLAGDREGSVLWQFLESERSREPYTPRPRYFEVSFGGKGGKTGSAAERDSELSQDNPVVIGGIRLRGKIDRIDVDEQAHETFTIVDYKSGKKTAKWTEIQRGLSLQLPLYLRVAEELIRREYPGIRGVAALYHKLMDADSPRVLGLAVKSERGTSFEKLSSRSGYVESEEALTAVIEAAIEKARSYVDGISHGAFRLTEKDLVANCAYCPYAQVCRVREAIDLDVLI